MSILETFFLSLNIFLASSPACFTTSYSGVQPVGDIPTEFRFRFTVRINWISAHTERGPFTKERPSAGSCRKLLSQHWWPAASRGIQCRVCVAGSSSSFSFYCSTVWRNMQIYFLQITTTLAELHPVLGSFQNCVLAPDFWPSLVSVGSESFWLCILCNSGYAVTLCEGLMSFSYGLEILTLKTKMRNK